MADLTTKYLGLNLKNPIIVGSSGLTDNVDNIRKLADNDAGAIVLKSLFEEQILNESNKIGNYSDYYGYPESVDYIKQYTKENSLGRYIDLIEEAKSWVTIPIIASINCISGSEWVDFTRKVEDAGADALEINISILPSDENKSSNDYEKAYFDIIKKVRSQTSLPIALKMSFYSSSLTKLIQKISWTGHVDGLVLFNRFYNPDIDIHNLKVISSEVYSTPQDISTSLRWMAILSGKVKSDLVASTGIHDGEGVIKQILAGAKAVQIVSTIYKNKAEYIPTILQFVESWMDEKGFTGIEKFRGLVNYEKAENPAAFERVQFMKYFSGIE